MGVLRALGNRKEKCDISHYHGSKTSGSQQSFLTDTTVCIVEQWIKSIGYGFVPAASMHKKVTRHFFYYYLQDHGLFRSRNFATMAI